MERSACRIFTLIGPAGVGKSRLVQDFLDRVDGMAAVARGRALSYGEGITYWPLVEILIQLGVEPTDVIRSSRRTRSWPPAPSSSGSPRNVPGHRPRRPALGGATVPRPGRARRRLVARTPDLPPLCCTPGASGRPAGLGRREAGRRRSCSTHFRWAMPRRSRSRFSRTSTSNPRREPESSRPPRNPLFIEEMALLARDADGTWRCRRRSRRSSRHDSTRWASASVRSSIAARSRGGLPSRRRHRTRWGRVTTTSPRICSRSSAGSRATSPNADPGRRRVPFSPSPDPRRRLRLASEGGRAQLHERFADWLEAHGDSTSRRRSSATTSSRRRACAPSSKSTTRAPQSSQRVRAGTSRPPDERRSSGRISTRRARSSSGRSSSFPTPGNAGACFPCCCTRSRRAATRRSVRGWRSSRTATRPIAPSRRSSVVSGPSMADAESEHRRLDAAYRVLDEAGDELGLVFARRRVPSCSGVPANRARRTRRTGAPTSGRVEVAATSSCRGSPGFLLTAWMTPRAWTSWKR